MTLELSLPDEFVDLVAARAAELLAAQSAEATSPWLNVDQAAEYLACSKQRIYDLCSERKVEFSKEGSRTLFRREWLNDLVDQGHPD